MILPVKITVELFFYEKVAQMNNTKVRVSLKVKPSLNYFKPIFRGL